ncbi:hypothetical protein ACIBTV_30770 [Micromonospora sp. NPDC049366]|uniref:hypothetical protein n=1 Tax=Micromonospora sp. NPDC049366 TaxID=3364271 RepID=UPI00379ADE44
MFAVLLLAPIAVLLLQARSTVDEDLVLVRGERHGVEYLRALNQVTVALVDAQSAAVTGTPVPAGPLDEAAAAMAAIDARIGAELLAQERWGGLQAKIGTLVQQRPASAQEAMVAYGEAGELLLELYAKVRKVSGLARDPESGSYHLQNALTAELPDTLVNFGRVADLAAVTALSNGVERDRAVAQLGAARAGAHTSGRDLIDDLLAAETEHSDLSGQVPDEIDALQQALETLGASLRFSTAPAAGGAGATGRQLTVDAASLATARRMAQAAAVKLADLIVADLDGQLAAREEHLVGRHRLVLGMAGLAALLALAAVGTALLAPLAQRGDAGPGRGAASAQRRPADGAAAPAGHDRDAALDGAAGTGPVDAPR